MVGANLRSTSMAARRTGLALKKDILISWTLDHLNFKLGRGENELGLKCLLAGLELFVNFVKFVRNIVTQPLIGKRDSELAGR